MTFFSSSQDFHQYLTSTNPNIKLSIEYSNTEIHFFDLRITVDARGHLHMTIYRKNTDRNTILKAASFHPKSPISNIPYGKFQSLRRICDTENYFEQAQDTYHRL